MVTHFFFKYSALLKSNSSWGIMKQLTLLRIWVSYNLSWLLLLFWIEMFFWEVAFELSSKTWLFELSERRSVKGFWLFVFLKFMSPFLGGFECWTLVVLIKKSSHALRVWMDTFLLVQHLTKCPLFPDFLQILPYVGQLPHYVFQNRIYIWWWQKQPLEVFCKKRCS